MHVTSGRACFDAGVVGHKHAPLQCFGRVQVKLREELARKQADLENAAATARSQAVRLQQAEHRATDTRAALSKSDVRCASLAAELAQTAQELKREQRDVASAQLQLASTQEQLAKAKDWNAVQVWGTHWKNWLACGHFNLQAQQFLLARLLQPKWCSRQMMS